MSSLLLVLLLAFDGVVSQVRNNHQPTNWNQPIWPQPTLQKPINEPNIITEEVARYLEQYMKNRVDQNLASTNNRVMRPEMQRRRDDTFTKKGKVDDVPLQLRKLPVATNFQNCITRSLPKAASCEDHLIKRLHQDAAEGRTVLDVGRRVCCALFWHKSCLSDVVVESCPDSSPVATDILMGARKLDLTLSCQKFNRDGCNRSTSLLDKTFATSTVLITLSSMIVMRYLFKVHI